MVFKEMRGHLKELNGPVFLGAKRKINDLAAEFHLRLYNTLKIISLYNE